LVGGSIYASPVAFLAYGRGAKTKANAIASLIHIKVFPDNPPRRENANRNIL
jgi:hypothetical protein